jgi:protein-tyrosine phosphatase
LGYKQKTNRGNIKAGKGRSTTVAIAALMKIKNMSRRKAQKLCIMRRPQVSRYIWRRQVLVDLEKKYDLPNDL